MDRITSPGQALTEARDLWRQVYAANIGSLSLYGAFNHTEKHEKAKVAADLAYADYLAAAAPVPASADPAKA